MIIIPSPIDTTGGLRGFQVTPDHTGDAEYQRRWHALWFSRYCVKYRVLLSARAILYLFDCWDCFLFGATAKTMARQDDKFQDCGIYSILTQKAIQGWVSTAGGLPSPEITAAFREAERISIDHIEGGDDAGGSDLMDDAVDNHSE